MARFRIPHGRSAFIALAATLGLIIAAANTAHATETPEKDSTLTSPPDCKFTSFSDWFNKGHFSGMWRTQSMATLHQKPLDDHWAIGTAFRLHYSTAHYKGWYVTVVGQFGYALGSSKLAQVSELTGQRARFELQMFDIEDPSNRKDFDRLENLTLSKDFKHASISAGRYSIESPFVNGQDTRLKANAFSGFTGHVNLGKAHNHKLEGAYVYGTSPRGTVRWFGLGESLGLLDNGLRPDGEKAEYAEETHTNGMYMAGWVHSHGRVQTEVWQYYADNLFAHSYGRLTYDFGENKSFNLGLEGVYQERAGEGGSADEQTRYYHNAAAVGLIGARIRYERKQSGFELASLSSIGDGTYLFPREWGRERFFSSVPRARVEGLGKFNDIAVQYDVKPNDHLLLIFTLAYLDAPPVEDHLHNKYSLIDHYLFNSELRYVGTGFLKNTDFRLIAAAHYPSGESFTPNDLYYKAEFVHLSFQMDMHF